MQLEEARARESKERALRGGRRLVELKRRRRRNWTTTCPNSAPGD